MTSAEAGRPISGRWLVPVLLVGVAAVAAAITVPRLVGDDARSVFDAAVEGDASAPGGAAGWEQLPTAPIRSSAREVAAWTGDELVLWGPSGGATFDPAQKSWRTIAAAPISSSERAAGAWTGDELTVIAFGCVGSDARCDHPSWRAAGYDPVDDRWRALAAPPLPDPAAQSALVATWAGDDLLVLAGTRSVAYDPSSDEWTAGAGEVRVDSDRPALLTAGDHTELWDAGAGSSDTTSFTVTVHDDAGDADDAGRRWGDPLPSLPSPVPRGVRSLTVVGSQVVALAGTTAVAYDRAGNDWGTLPDLPVALGEHLTVWTGDELLVTGLAADGTTVALSYRTG